jgi:hypothetical protein
MPEDRDKSDTKSDRPAQRKKPILSIRARLIVLALLAIAPLMFERVHALESARAKRTADAHTQVIELARQGAEAQEETVSSVRALLQIVASVFVKMPFETADCNQYLTNLTSNIPWIRALSIAGTGVQIKSSSETRAIGLNIGDRSHFKHALEARVFTLSIFFVI